MKIFVKIKPNAKEESVRGEVGGNVYFVSVKEPPIDGRANQALVKVVAEYFKVAPSCVRITSGHTGHQKILEIIK